MEISITHTARTYPRLPYREIARDILGNSYTLSLVFVGATRAKALNKSYRNKTYTPNVLSFPLDTHTGEIYITPVQAQREAERQHLSTKNYVGFLFIHGLLHLKGHRHGDTMTRAEQRYISKYNLK